MSSSEGGGLVTIRVTSQTVLIGQTEKVLIFESLVEQKHSGPPMFNIHRNK